MLRRNRCALDLNSARKIARESIRESRRLAQEARRMAADTKELVDRIKKESKRDPSSVFWNCRP
jgi:signal transduction histidine kinase